MAKSSTKNPAGIRNKKAHLKYQVLETLECGLMLAGTEVKAIRDGQAQLSDAFARIKKDEVWLYGFHIGPYQHASVNSHAALRARKLLLHRRQIHKWAPKLSQQGLTLVPLSVYFNERGIAKVELALCQGKGHHDKRQDLKKREHNREMQRAMRRNR